MISEFGSGSVPGSGETGGARLIDTGTDVEPPAAAVVDKWSVAVFVPTGRRRGSAVIVRSMPSGGIVPLDGVTVSHGSSTVAVKLCAAPTDDADVPLDPGICTFCITCFCVPYEV